MNFLKLRTPLTYKTKKERDLKLCFRYHYYESLTLRKTIINFRLSFLISVISLTLSACGSHYGAAEILSQPSGATVINPVNGKVLGVTPVTLTWKNPNTERKHIPIRLIKSGFYEKTTSFWLKMSHQRATLAEKTPKIVDVELDKKGG